MALVNSMFLAGCASVRGPSRLARLQEASAVEPAIQSWESVAFIPVLSSVEVDLTTGETLSGRFRSADDREFVLEQDGLLRRVPRAEIQRVVLYQGRHTVAALCGDSASVLALALLWMLKQAAAMISGRDS